MIGNVKEWFVLRQETKVLVYAHLTSFAPGLPHRGPGVTHSSHPRLYYIYLLYPPFPLTTFHFQFLNVRRNAFPGVGINARLTLCECVEGIGVLFIYLFICSG